MKKHALRMAFRTSIPVLTGYLFLGLGFGILLQSKGYSFLWAFFMAFFMYAGSMQYVAIDLLATGADLITTAFMTIMINIRHLFYGLSLIQKYKGLGWKKLLMIHELTDETYALVAGSQVPAGTDKSWFYFFLSILDHVYWIIGCTLGALLSSAVNINTKGIDFVMTALFVVIFTDQWLGTREHRPALIGMGCAVVSLILFGGDGFILPAMITIISILVLMRKPLDKEEEKHENT